MLSLRLATPADLPHLVELFDMSNAGLTRIAFERLAGDGEDWIAVGCREMARDDVEYSFRNTIIAQVDDHVAGMLIFSVQPDDMPAPDLAALPLSEHGFATLKQRTAASLYLRNMAVFERFQGQQIATRLLNAVIRTGGKIGVPRVTAIVHESNVKLLAHYARRGLIEVARTNVLEHPVYDAQSAWILLSSPMPGSLVLEDDVIGVGS